MVKEPGLLESLADLVFELGVPAVRFQVARTLADLAETVDNRLVIALRSAKALMSLLRSTDDDDPRTIGHAVRCYANLAAFAGHTSDCSPPETTRFGATRHREYGLDADSNSRDSRRRFLDDDSEESDFGDSDKGESAGPEAGDADGGATDGRVGDGNEGMAVEIEAEAPESSAEEDDEEAEDVNFYWSTPPGLAMARNFNLHCLPHILEQIVSCGALGLILSATERQQARHAKTKGNEDEGDDAGADLDVRKYAIRIVRQLTLDLQNLVAQATDLTEAGKHVETHLNTCPECVGLKPVFAIP
jgi:hypothetical protein